MITIKFQEPSKSYAPGESIAGTIAWTKLESKTDSLEVRLIWYTEGKGDRDIEIVDVLPFENPGPKDTLNFQFTAPTRPFSFSAKLISLVWAVELVQFPSEEGTKETIVISSDRNEIILEKSIKEHILAKQVWFQIGR